MRKEDVEDCASVSRVLTGADADEAALLLDNALADPEAKASTGGPFGAEEGVKEALHGLAAHTLTCVCNGDAKTAAFGWPMCGLALVEDDTAFAADCVEGIADKVGDDLPEFAGEDQARTGGGVSAIEEDFGITKAAFIEAGDGIQNFADLGDRWAGLLTVEAKRLRGDMRNTCKFGLSGGEESSGLRRQRVVLFDEVEKISI